PLNVPVAPAPLSVMVSVSVAPTLLSATVTPANGWTAASAVVVWAAVVTVMVGAATASLSVTVMALLLALPPAELGALRGKVVVVLEGGAPALGVNSRASSSWLMVAGDAAARL